MSDGMEALCLRLLDLARAQKTALEAGNLDEALTLAGKRQQVIQEIQKFDGSMGKTGGGGKSPAPASVLREILSVDEEARGIVRTEMQDVSVSISKINTFKVLCQGAYDGSLTRGHISSP